MSTQTQAQKDRAEAEARLSATLLAQAKALQADLAKAEGDEMPPEDGAPVEGAEPDGDEPPMAPPGSEAPPMEEEGGDMTLEQAVEAFRAMTPEQRSMYRDALEQVESDGGAGGEENADPAPDLDEGAPPPPAGGDDALKSELASTKGALAKMETRFAALEKRLAKSMPASAPIRRAAHGTNRPPVKTPPKALSKAEIMTKLTRVAASALTKREDRDLINKFALGQINTAGINHLLKDPS